MKKYNTTQLNTFADLDRFIQHRDWYAHLNRFSYVTKIHKVGQSVLDFGCGDANLLESLYRNKHECTPYVGVDIRKRTIEANKDKWKIVRWAQFIEDDLVETDKNYGNEWDYVVSFEVIEHIGKKNANKFLSNIARCMNANTTLLLSTPNYNGKDCAANHMINGEVGEFTYEELRTELEQFFIIENVFGTFASISDYKEYVDSVPHLKEFFYKAKTFFDSNMLSVVMAPVIPPRMARNCLWICKLKPEVFA